MPTVHAQSPHSELLTPQLTLSDDTHSRIISFDFREIVRTAIQDDDEFPVLKRLRLDGGNALTKKAPPRKLGITTLTSGMLVLIGIPLAEPAKRDAVAGIS